MAVSKRLRYEILRRDNHTCRYCGDAAPDVKLTVDHVVPVALGGSDDPSNLVAACADCNAGKTSSSPDAPLVDDVAQDALRWSKAMERAAELQRDRQSAMRQEIILLGEWWDDTWCTYDKLPFVLEGSWHYPDDPGVEYGWAVEVNDVVVRAFKDEEDAIAYADKRRNHHIPPRPADWVDAARTWLISGITDHDYVPLMEMVKETKGHVSWDAKWKYFAGCVWNVIRERQAIASDLLEASQEDS